jgi:type VI secretion system protein ImpG
MDPRLLDFYEAELEYLHAQSKVFAESHETAARRLGLNSSEPDPYVERLLEGVAFLSSRVHLKINDQFPEFTQHLLQAVQPHYLAPTPSICIAAFEPAQGDQGLVKGHVVPRRTQLTADPPGSSRTAVTFETGHEVTLWPLTITSAEYVGSRAATAAHAARAGIRAQAALTLRIEPSPGIDLTTIEADYLDIYLDGSEAVPNELYRQLVSEAVAVVARPLDSQDQTHVLLDTPVQHGFDEDESLLPHDGRTLGAYRILTEYFACPERFRFVRLRSLRKALQLSSGAIEITILLSRSSDVLVQSVSERNFKLFATPAINLFEKQLNRVPFSQAEHEFKVVPDREGPLDFEVFRLLEVKAYDRDNRDPRTVAPLFAFGSLLYDYRSALFYTTAIRMRRLSRRERRLRRREDYTGTETYLSVTSPGDPERLDTIHDLSVRALVTNRELPELLEFASDSHLHAGGIPARSIRVVRSPTRPLPPMGIGDAAWRIIGHITPNYAALLPEQGGDAELLRNHLALYGRPEDPVMRSQIDGILTARGTPITRRVPGLGRMAMARGLKVEIELDDSSYDQSRIFMFTAVIERFLSEFAIVNSFTEAHFRTKLQGEIASWTPRIGRRQAI